MSKYILFILGFILAIISSEVYSQNFDRLCNGSNPVRIDNVAFDNFYRSVADDKIEAQRKGWHNIPYGLGFTSKQVKKLCNIYFHDEDKLSLMMKLYALTVDKKNYSVVINTLAFSRSRAEMNAYIENYPINQIIYMVPQ